MKRITDQIFSLNIPRISSDEGLGASTETSLPPVIIGFNSHLSPFFTVTVGVFSKLSIVLPYPTPPSYTYTSVIDPLTIGVAVIIPTVPAAVAVC